MRWSGPGWVAGGAPQARRKSLRLRRAGMVSRGPLNADVRQHLTVLRLLIAGPLLVVLLMIHQQTANTLLCAVLWAIAAFLMSLIFSSSSVVLDLVVGAASFLIALGFFALLEKLEDTGWWWIAMPVGGILLLAVA